MAVQGELQARAEADFQLHVDRLRPVGQAAFRLRAGEAQAHRVALDRLLAAFPGQAAHQAVEGRGGAAVLGQQGGGVACQVAEPRPAHRHAAAHRLPALAARLLAEPDQRRFAGAAVAEQLRALLGDQQFGRAGLHPPAGQVVEQFAADHGGLAHGGIPGRRRAHYSRPPAPAPRARRPARGRAMDRFRYRTRVRECDFIAAAAVGYNTREASAATSPADA
ncbi:hypothetical protein D3C78_1230380 [compost metagenome]